MSEVSTPTRIGGCPHFRGFDCTQVYVNAFGTMRSVRIIVDVRISGGSGRRGSTVVISSYEVAPTLLCSLAVHLPG